MIKESCNYAWSFSFLLRDQSQVERRNEMSDERKETLVELALVKFVDGVHASH